jgi:ABC-type Fe3+ transport system substrate-binding protein
LIAGFNEHYGLNLDARYTPGPPSTEMAAKLAEERRVDRRASTGIFIGYDSAVVQLIQADALAGDDWTSWAPNIRNPRLVAPQGMAVTFQSSIPGISYNSARVIGDAVPRSLAALLKPEYKGRVASTPYASGFDRLATPELWGEQRAVEYATALADQLGGLMRCNELERLASGEFDILALNCSQSNSLSIKATGAPIDYTIPTDAPMIPTSTSPCRSTRPTRAAPGCG